MKRLISILAMFSLIFAGVGIAQDDASTIDRGSFAAVDGDGDGSLTLGEFGTGLYDVVTAGRLTLGEEGFEAFMRHFDQLELEVTFDGIDANGDDVVTGNQEFTPGVAIHVFEAWDVSDDAALSLDEYRDGWFAVLDADGNGYVTEEEFAPLADWFGADFGAVGTAGPSGVSADDFQLVN